MTNMKKTVSKIEKEKSNNSAPAKTKTVKVAAPLPAVEVQKNSTVSILETDLRSMIAKRAYFLAERRNFAPGCETDDWFAAEAEVKKLST